MIIAKKGKFALVTNLYLTEHTYFTSDIEIVKYFHDSEGKKSCYSICDFERTKEKEFPNVISCGNRLIEAIEELEDITDLKQLIEIGAAIISCDDVPSGFSRSF